MGGLTTKWVYTTHGDVSANPVVDGNSVYVMDWGGYLQSVDKSTGALNWAHPLSDYTGYIGHSSIIGLPINSTSRTSPVLAGNSLIFGDQGHSDMFGLPVGLFGEAPTASVMAVNKTTWALLWKTFVSNDLWSGVTSSPIVFGNHVYVGVCSLEESKSVLPFPLPFVFRGKVVSLNRTTGAVEWETYTVPAGYAGGAIWGGTPSIDPKRGSLYVSTGNNYAVPAGAPEETNQHTPGNNFDSIISLDLKDGHIKWAMNARLSDTWNLGVQDGFGHGITNPGPDFDFGSAPNLFTAVVNGKKTDLVGCGEKSGNYWAVNADTGVPLWNNQVGPGGVTGGIQWGSATDGNRVYIGVTNSFNIPYTPLGGGPQLTGGFFACLDAATGNYIWQRADPSGKPYGMVTSANGVMYEGSTSGTMYALNAATGDVLWQFNAGSSVVSGAAIVDGTVYWGSGYGRFGGAFGTPGNKLFAFGLPSQP